MFGITNRCNLACDFCSRDTARESAWSVADAAADHGQPPPAHELERRRELVRIRLLDNLRHHAGASSVPHTMAGDLPVRSQRQELGQAPAADYVAQVTQTCALAARAVG